MGLTRAGRAAAAARDPALHRHHPGDGGRRAGARRRSFRRSPTFSSAGSSSPTTRVRPRVLSRPSIGRGSRGPTARAVHDGDGPSLRPLVTRRGLACWPTPWASRSTRSTARCPTRSRARGLLRAVPPGVCHLPPVGDALELLAPRRRSSSRAREEGRSAAACRGRPDLSKLPDDPGVYVFRDERGRPLYVGKSVSLRSRARSHFCAPAGWTEKAEIVDYRPTNSELGALVLENRLIKQWQPPGNRKLKRTDGYVYLRCRLEQPYPVLEVDPEPAPGRAVNVGPLRGRKAAVELADQLTSLFRLRHCGKSCPVAITLRSTGRWAAARPPAWATWTRTPIAARWTRRSRCSAAPSRTPPLGSWARSTSRWARRQRLQRYERAADAAPARRAPGGPAGPVGRGAARRSRRARSSCWPATPTRSGSTRSGWWTAGWPTGGRCPVPASWPNAPRRPCVSPRAIPHRSRSKRWTRSGSCPPGWPTTTSRRLPLAEEPGAAELAAFAA